MGLDACIPYGWNDFLFNAVHNGGGIRDDVLNVFLLLPLTTSLVLTSHRILPTVTVAVLLSPAIELVQSQLPGRSCSTNDVLTDDSGALLGITIGWAALRRLQRHRTPFTSHAAPDRRAAGRGRCPRPQPRRTGIRPRVPRVREWPTGGHRPR